SRLRRVRRKFADQATMIAAALKTASKFALNPYIKPVLGAIKVLFKVRRLVRKEVLESFGDIVSAFTNVEIFLIMFPGDINIRNAFIDLTVTIFDSIEHVIGFFISKERKFI
ncbi:hypothetical protein QBC46DRAFT_267884, partial [Diplogelasinospora grovesii]